MTNEKPEFNVKGIPKELTFDNGPSSSCEAYFKSKEEQGAAIKHLLERAKNSSFADTNKTQ